MINSYDFDGVVYIPRHRGLVPRQNDIIVTGRVVSERQFVEGVLEDHKIKVAEVFLNNIELYERTRYKSAVHKGTTLNKLRDASLEIGLHFEDDPLQAEVVKELCPWLNVVLLTHNLVEK